MLIKLSVRYLTRHWLALLIIVIAQILQSFAALSLPTLNADIIDYGVVTGDIGYIWRTGGIMLSIAFLQFLSQVVVAYLAARTAMSMGRDIRADVVARVQTFGVIEVSEFTAPSLITRTTNDVQQIQSTAQMTFMIMIQAPVMMIGAVVMALRQDALLSWLLVAVIPVIATVMTLGMFKMGPLFQQLQRRIDTINKVMREQLTGARVIRAFIRQDEERQRFDEANAQLRTTATRVGMWMAFLFPAVMFVVMAAQVGVIWFGGIRVADGMMVGSLIAFLNYLMQIFVSVMMTVMMFMVVPRAEVAARRVREVLTTSARITSPASPVSLPTAPSDVVFSGVTVRYPGAEQDVLRDVDFTIPVGSTTAIIGSTGSGKTTLINLLPRILDPVAGTITIGGVNIAEADLNALRHTIAMVPQRAFLFSGTIRSNLQVADPDASDEAMWEALETAQAAEFVRELAGGLDAEVEQGGRNFSGGQRQRLTIARALVRKAILTVYDDSFSALDYATDAKLRDALSRQFADRSLLIIAQRVATIRHADQILVLDDGRIAGRGTHDELMDTCQTYREIVLSQMSEKEAA